MIWVLGGASVFVTTCLVLFRKKLRGPLSDREKADKEYETWLFTGKHPE